MGCVLTLALVENGRITIGHVGDSRLYLIWNGAIRKLTSDHSPVGEGEDAGELTEAEAMVHPRRNEVFRDVGSRLREPADREFIEIRQCRFRPDAAILLCSDGLTDQLTSAQVRDIVEQYEHLQNILKQAATGLAFMNALGWVHRDVKPDNILVNAAGDVRLIDFAISYRIPTGLARLFTGRMAFLTYGLLLGMLLWAVLRTKG